MTVRKFRGVEEMPRPARRPTPLEGLTAACELSETVGALGPSPQAPRGVRKFRSVEEADAHRRSWEASPGERER